MNDAAFHAVLDDLIAHIEAELEQGTRSVELESDMVEWLRNPLKASPLPEEPQIRVSVTDRSSSRPLPRSSTEAPKKTAPASTPTPVSRPSEIRKLPPATSALAAIEKEIAQCKNCLLHKTRTQVVPGQGAARPEILFVGEAPGADEDARGIPFCGRAGHLLTRMIEAMGLTREEVFIGNILKCRPPENRKPLPDEMETCLPFLKQQIVELQPNVIIAMGKTAVEGLVGLHKTGITKLRGQWLSFEGIDLMPTFHPAYLLRSPSKKREVWEDLQTVLRHLGRPIPQVKSNRNG